MKTIMVGYNVKVIDELLPDDRQKKYFNFVFTMDLLQ